MGIILAIVGYFISGSDRFEWVEKTLIPEYYNAKKSLNTILAYEEVNAESIGIKEIEKIVINQLSKVPENRDKLDIISNSTLVRISFSMGKTIIPSGEPLSLLGARLDYNGKEIVVDDISVKVIEKGVLDLKENGIFKIESWLFWVGIAFLFGSRLSDNLINKKKLFS